MQRNERAIQAILRVLQERREPVGASRLASMLLAQGVHLRPRTVRLHLLEMDRTGLTRLVTRRAGREITAAGRQALAQGGSRPRAEFVHVRMERLAYQMNLSENQDEGAVAVNVCLVRPADLSRVLVEMRPFFSRGLDMGTKLALARAGTILGEAEVPPGHVGLGSVCSLAVNALLLDAGIPVRSRFGGLLEMHQGAPTRFTEAIAYEGCTSDPIGMFIRAGMTRVRELARTGSGIVSASLREVPAAAAADLARRRQAINRLGFGQILTVGQPEQPLFDLPVSRGAAGLVVLGGLNPIAAAYEAGVPIRIEALAGLQPQRTLKSIDDIRRDIRGERL